jgi:hypothetical protein
MMQPVPRADRSPTPIPTPTPTRWRVAVDVEFVVEADDQEAAICEAEGLFSHVMPSQRAPDRAKEDDPPRPDPPPPGGTELKVDVVMSLPIRVGRQG